MLWGSAAEWASASAAWVSAFANTGVAIAAGIAALQGVRSLRAWRDETIGRRRIELAEEVIADFYEARDIFKSVRAVGGFAGEGEQRPGRDTEPEDVRERRDTYGRALKRLDDEIRFFSQVQARRYRVIATFGPKAAEPYERLKGIYDKIVVAARMLSGTAVNVWSPMWEELNDTVFDSGNPNDAINAELNDLVMTVEATFRKEIEARTER